MTLRSHARKTTLPLAIALCLMLTAGLALAENALVVNPYEGVDWDAFAQYKANLHTHTTQSDGKLDPSQVIDEYHQRGYDILAITDHNRNTWPWTDFERDPAEFGMLAISGNELSRHHHTGALFCQLETEETDHEAALREVAELDGLAILYHPGRYWQPAEDAPNTVPADDLAKYVELLTSHEHVAGMEIINQGNRYPHDRLLWDALLTEMMPARPVHGVADDDMHGSSQLGRDWTVFPLTELTEEAVREALVTGAFYSASVSTHPEDDRAVDGTPVIERITHDEDAGTITVEAMVGGEPLGDAGYRWIADGEALHVGPTLAYRDDERIGSYARLELLGTGGTAFTNAFGFVSDTVVAAAPGPGEPDPNVAPAPEGSFTVVVMPDTQDYVDGGSPSGDFSGEEVFHEITRWIVDNREAQRVAFVSHVGDIVNSAGSRDEWEVARVALDTLHGAVPYGLSPGNHDMNTSTGEKPLFEEFFGGQRYADFEWYGGTPDNNANSYQLISAEGVDLLFMHLECNAPDDVLQWAGEVLDRHADRRAIITTHMWLGPIVHWGDLSYSDIPKGRMQWIKCHRDDDRGNTPQQMWDKLVRFHPNVMMVLCGDQRGTQALRMQTVGVHDNIVHELLSDIRDGYIRLMRFHPADNRIEVMTYSPTLEMFCDGTSKTMSGPRQPIGTVTDITQHQFILSHDLTRPVPTR
ncbi:MAG: metallophosphoesterase [Armatimonadota bacterium]